MHCRIDVLAYQIEGALSFVFSRAARATRGWWWLQEESGVKPATWSVFLFKSNKKISTDDAFELLNNTENTRCSGLPLRPEGYFYSKETTQPKMIRKAMDML